MTSKVKASVDQIRSKKEDMKMMLRLLMTFMFTSSVTLAGQKNFCKPLIDYTDRIDRPMNRTICVTRVQKVVDEVPVSRCIDVESVECDVVLVPECTTTVSKDVMMLDVPDIKEKSLKKCIKTTTMEEHVKEVYECKNVTKTHCTTLWKLNGQGKKVWAGNEDDCKEVTWEECKPINKTVPFPVPHMTCDDIQVPYNDVTTTQMDINLIKTDCVVEPKVECKTFTNKKCGSVTYTRIMDVPVKECQDVTILMPSQDEVHKQWCLFNQVHNIDFNKEVNKIIDNQKSP